MKAVLASQWSVVVVPLVAGLIHLGITPGTFFEWFVAVQVLVVATAFTSTRLTHRAYRPFLLPSIGGGAAFAALYYTSAVSPANVIVGAVTVAVASYVGYALAQI